MYRRRLFPLLIAGFLGLFLLGGIRNSAYRTGYYQGLNNARVQAQPAAPSVADGLESPNAGPESGRFDGPRADSREFRGNSEFSRDYRGQDRYDGYHGHRHGGFGFFWFIGGLFRLFFTILFIGFIFKLIARGPWRNRWNSEWGQEMRSKFDETFNGGPSGQTNSSNDSSSKSDNYTSM